MRREKDRVVLEPGDRVVLLDAEGRILAGPEPLTGPGRVADLTYQGEPVENVYWAALGPDGEIAGDAQFAYRGIRDGETVRIAIWSPPPPPPVRLADGPVPS